MQARKQPLAKVQDKAAYIRPNVVQTFPGPHTLRELSAPGCLLIMLKENLYNAFNW